MKCELCKKALLRNQKKQQYDCKTFHYDCFVDYDRELEEFNQWLNRMVKDNVAGTIHRKIMGHR